MKNLKEARKAKKMTQTELAQKLNLTKSAISKYENGQLDPSLKTLIEICKILDKTSDELLDIKKKPKDKLSNEEIMVIRGYRKASEETKKIIRRILEIEHTKTPIEEEKK